MQWSGPDHQEGQNMTIEHVRNWLILTVLIALLGGCANAGEKTGAYVDDSGLASKVKSQMLADETVEGTNITVNTTKGVVTLSGTAASQEESHRAEEIARNVQGVKEVENHIRVQ
jgi:osmotically-inducible protein OsmY